jgi:hypothetical protein
LLLLLLLLGLRGLLVPLSHTLLLLLLLLGVWLVLRGPVLLLLPCRSLLTVDTSGGCSLAR